MAPFIRNFFLRMKNILFSFLMMLFSLSAISQQYRLSGKVTRKGEPISGVTVFVSSLKEGTQTNDFGEYEITLQQGQYTIDFVYGNRKSYDVNLTSNKILDVDFGNAEEVLAEVFLKSIRVDADSPITFSNLSNEEIESRNLGQDIPVLMNYLPSVVSTTDAGNGVGYTGIRVRGSDATRTNVTINGVPYNDSESQGTFWVNLGDLVSSTENIQLQRGVGTSTNGAGAFGASINILTDSYSEEASAEILNSYGSYNTHKHTAAFNTGLFNDHWEFSGRASLIKSDGYIDRAESELKSYFLQGAYVANNTLVKAIMFGGKQRTYQAWNGIPGDVLDTNRTYNPSGKYTDKEGNIKFYDNQTDNYQQDHYQLLWNQKYDTNWSSNLALHYTYGRGYYEEYEENASLNSFGLPNFMADGKEVTTSDLVNTSWLDNHFYGTTFSLNYKNSKVDAIFGGGWNRYDGDHFGEVIYTRFARNNDPLEPFYFNNAVKTDFNIYGKTTVSITDDFAVYGDLQLRTIDYEAAGPTEELEEFNVNDNFSFFNPKFGFTYQFNKAHQLYGSFARAHREPVRRDYEAAISNNKPNPTEEKLNDYELGWRFNDSKTKINANLYFMDYKDQLVLTGQIDNEGAALRENSDESYRLGLEIDATFRITDYFSIRPNIALSRNKNIDFLTIVDGEQVNIGDTDISFSPSIVGGNMIQLNPLKNLQVNWLTKYVGEQYMSNIEAESSELDDYLINDLNIQYTLNNVPLFKEILFTGLVNNIFDVEYISNGYYDDGYVGYYPQATINFLAGVTLKF